MDLGRIGIWTHYFDFQPADRVREVAAALEGMGYRSLWVGENVGREVFTHAQLLLAATERMVVATGIANIYARDPLATAAAQLTLAEAYGGRFLLGLGVSHARLVQEIRGHRYEPPVGAMERYLDAMDQARGVYRAASVPEEPPCLLAALGPNMLTLARDRTNGAHTYLVSPQHTATARTRLGPEAWLIPEQAVVLDNDPVRARETARRHLRRYLTLPSYVANLRRLGFSEDDFRDHGSDRLVSALVACGNEDAIHARVDEHLAAGADHVCIQVLSPDPRQLPVAQWEALAPALV